MIKVLGIGSPFGDDQLGWKVIDGLKHQLALEPRFYPHLLLEQCDRPGMRLIELMRNSDTVFLIDAIKTGDQVGAIHRLQGDDIKDVKTLFSTHHMGIADALRLGEVLHELPEELILYGIEIDTIGFDSIISDPVKQAINKVVLLIANELRCKRTV